MMPVEKEIVPLDKVADLGKGKILIPEHKFEKVLEDLDWTWHQIARNEFPEPFSDLEEFQLACIQEDLSLWVPFFLREPEDPDHKDPYTLWDYQEESMAYPGDTIHCTAAEVGKTREIVGYGLGKANTVPGGSGLIGAPMQSHLDEIIEAMEDQLTWNPELGKARWHKRHKDGWKKHPHHAFYFQIKMPGGQYATFKIDFKPSGDSGNAYRGVHARTFAIKDEAAKDKNKRQWSEFWRALKPGCVAKIYSVPDGDRSSEFHKLKERAKAAGKKDTKEQEVEIDGLKDASKHVKNIEFRLFYWKKPDMPYPYWSSERKQWFIDQYGGEDSPEYQHNVLGEDGDPENPVFPWHQFGPCIKEIPEYRGMKVLVNAAQDTAQVRGYKCRQMPGDSGPVSMYEDMLNTEFVASEFFKREVIAEIPTVIEGQTRTVKVLGESDFTRLIKSHFQAVPGLKRAGADFGFSGDPTELLVYNIIGERKRLVARLNLKHVTYDIQCQALNALDDLYEPKHTTWGLDLGNAGSAVMHDLIGLPHYEKKDYEDRLKGFMFESTTDDIEEDGEPVIDKKTEKPLKTTVKCLATKIMTKKVQRQEIEFPPDQELISHFTNHTSVNTGKHPIYRKKDDHTIDASRGETLAGIFDAETEDLFACGN